MNIKIKIINALTREVVVDNTITVDSTYEVAKANHDVFSQTFGDCHVNFSFDDGSFIFGAPYNMMQDEIAYHEDRMTWQEYCDKWYNGSPAGGNDDDDILFRMEDEDFLSRDSVCF